MRTPGRGRFQSGIDPAAHRSIARVDWFRMRIVWPSLGAET
jgi:hypothetical protein